ncbi:MAG: hypothetical protein JXL97_17025 [Bacteroidales bacterium]|nr:hypothetical protein [Bacteroidales bacterium]
MKKLTLLLLGFCIFTGIYAQNTNLEQEIKVIMESYGYELSTSQYAYISEGNTAYHYKTFYEGNDYAIIGFPEDNGVNDIDLYLYDGDGTLLAEGSSEDNYEILEYTPYSTREMKIVIENYDSDYSSTEYKVKFMIFWIESE